MGLDINTEKGRVTVEQEKMMIDRVVRHFGTEWDIIGTSKTGAAVIDGIVVHEFTIKAITEHKCRDVSINTIRTVWNNEWMVTYDKILKCAEVSKLLNAPFYGILYCLADTGILAVKITNDKGEIIVPMRIMRSKTQKTVNGNTIVRTNAYINMDSAKEIK